MLGHLATAVITASSEMGHEELAPVIAPPFVIGGIMLALMFVLLFITVSYTNLGNRHSAVEEHSDPHRQHPAKHPGH